MHELQPEGTTTGEGRKRGSKSAVRLATVVVAADVYSWHSLLVPASASLIFGGLLSVLQAGDRTWALAKVAPRKERPLSLLSQVFMAHYVYVSQKVDSGYVAWLSDVDPFRCFVPGNST